MSAETPAKIIEIITISDTEEENELSQRNSTKVQKSFPSSEESKNPPQRSFSIIQYCPSSKVIQPEHQKPIKPIVLCQETNSHPVPPRPYVPQVTPPPYDQYFKLELPIKNTQKSPEVILIDDEDEDYKKTAKTDLQSIESDPKNTELPDDSGIDEDAQSLESQERDVANIILQFSQNATRLQQEQPQSEYNCSENPLKRRLSSTESGISLSDSKNDDEEQVILRTKELRDRFLIYLPKPEKRMKNNNQKKPRKMIKSEQKLPETRSFPRKLKHLKDDKKAKKPFTFIEGKGFFIIKSSLFYAKTYQTEQKLLAPELRPDLRSQHLCYCGKPFQNRHTGLMCVFCDTWYHSGCYAIPRILLSRYSANSTVVFICGPCNRDGSDRWTIRPIYDQHLYRCVCSNGIFHRNVSYVKCDGPCGGYYHNSCMGLIDRLVDRLEQWHCAGCEQDSNKRIRLERMIRPLDAETWAVVDQWIKMHWDSYKNLPIFGSTVRGSVYPNFYWINTEHTNLKLIRAKFASNQYQRLGEIVHGVMALCSNVATYQAEIAVMIEEDAKRMQDFGGETKWAGLKLLAEKARDLFEEFRVRLWSELGVELPWPEALGPEPPLPMRMKTQMTTFFEVANAETIPVVKRGRGRPRKYPRLD